MNQELSMWTAITRKMMDKCGWTDGHLLVHIQEQFGMAQQAQLECLMNGATGIWASLSKEGAALGHADSCVTILNMIRFGNKKVLKKFNCDKLREASRNVTFAVTGEFPNHMTAVVGDRALDIVFSTNFDKRN